MISRNALRELTHTCLQECVNAVHDELYETVFITGDDWERAMSHAVASALADYDNYLVWHATHRPSRLAKWLPRFVRDCTDEYCDWRQTCLWFVWHRLTFAIPGTTVNRSDD
jgi:uncharacterized short protein YbdD (DUF466 family)